MASITDTAAKTEKVTRPRKSPAEKAQIQLNKANEQYAKAQAALRKIEEQFEAAKAELTRAEQQVDYASRNPDLPAVAGTNAAG